MNMPTRSYRKRRTLFAVSLMLYACPAFLFAQTIEETLVTAQKREESEFDVGIGISRFTGEQLIEQGVNSSTELTKTITSLNLVSPQGELSQTNFFLRGVGLIDYTDANENPIGIYLDNVYRGAIGGLSFQLFDIERVEVLKGPQGILYGRNTSGGLVHYISHKPNRDFEAYLTGRYGDYNQISLEGAAGGSLNKQFLGRLAFATERHDGYITNRIGPDFSAKDSQAVRAQLHWVPEETAYDLLLNLNYAKNDSTVGGWEHQSTKLDTDGNRTLPLSQDENYWGTCAGCDVLGYRDTDNNSWAGDYDRDGKVYSENSGASLTLNWNLGNTDVVAIGSYQKTRRNQQEDTDSGPTPLEASFPAKTTEHSQELRIQTNRGRHLWTAGLYFYSSNVIADYDVDASAIGFVKLNTHMDQRTHSNAVFGQHQYQLNEQWQLEMGVRLTREKKTIDYEGFELSGLYQTLTSANLISISPTRPTGTHSFLFNQRTVGDLARHDDLLTTARIGLNYKPAENHLIYTSFSRGAKSAGFNTGFLDESLIFASNTASTVPYKGEHINAWEIGSKSIFPEHNAYLKAALFFYDYQDLQAYRFELLNQVIFNTDGRYFGAEAEYQTDLSDQLQFSISATLLNTMVKDIADRFGTLHNRNAVLAPTLSTHSSLSYRWKAFNGEAKVILSHRYQAETWFDIQNSITAREDGYQVVDLRLQWESANRGYQLASFVENLLEEEYLVYTSDFTTSFGLNQLGYGKPRWVGVSATIRF